jgi:hypothetical protein
LSRQEGPPLQIFREPREARTREFLQRIIEAGRLQGLEFAHGVDDSWITQA